MGALIAGAIPEIEYLGIQNNSAGIPSFMLFHDCETGSSFGAHGLDHAVEVVYNLRKKFRDTENEKTFGEFIIEKIEKLPNIF